MVSVEHRSPGILSEISGSMAVIVNIAGLWNVTPRNLINSVAYIDPLISGDSVNSGRF
jgi:hypothetical protein